MKNRVLQMRRALSIVLFVLLLSAMVVNNATAQSFTVGSLNYSVNDDGVSVTVTGHVNGEDATGELVIPETVVNNGISYTITAIGDGAFIGCSGLTGNLILPNTVTSIGSWAFYQCSGITGSLIIPNSVITLGNLAFASCGFTGGLTLSNSLIDIGNHAFAWCGGFTGNLTLPNSVTIIRDFAFYDCSSFTGGLTISNSVTSIGWGAFSNCSGFTGNLTLPNALTTIGDYAFNNCSGFTGSLTIPNSVTSIGAGAFYWCSGFTGNLTLPNSLTTIGDYAFFNCSGFTGGLTIPNSVTSIGNYVFDNCSGFTGNLTLPNALTEIGDFAFGNCSGFTGNLTIPNTVISIGEYAFYNCVGFTGSLIIPDNLTSISNGAFCYCTGLTGSLTIPNSVISIGNSAFIGCSGLTDNLTLPNALAEIGDWAFAGCDGFTTVHYNAANLVVLTDNTPSCVFANCNLLLFIIGEDVETLPNCNMFGYYSTLQIIESNAIVPPIVGGSYTFDVINRDIPIIVPCGSLAAYQSAAYWNDFNNIQENCPQTQTIALSQGWNWFSPNVDITLNDLKAALVAALPGTNITISSQNNGSTTYNGTVWRGTLTSLDVTQMYKIKTAAGCEITLTGLPLIPAEHSITIHNGANWIGFPLNVSMSLSNAFAGFAVNGDMIRSKDGSASYNGTTWRGTLNSLVPGQGYIYKSNATNDRTFIFPSSAK